jgi:CDP-glucose 4,6-dehydratase
VGSWLAYALALNGAEVVGLSLPAPAPDWATRAGLASGVRNLTGDIRDYETVLATVRDERPEVVFHLAAQPFVLMSYEQPLATLATNVMGTAHVLEALRTTGNAACCVVVTSDKCYATADTAHAETDPLGGDDPYSASKAAAEVVTGAFVRSFGAAGLPPVATARAGNIIGGGDWAPGRIVPDWARSVRDGAPLLLRHPHAARPWQHVLDALAGYILLADALMSGDPAFSGAWNFGPAPHDAATVGHLVDLLGRSWQARTGQVARVVSSDDERGPGERHFLALDSAKAQARLSWTQRLDLPTAVDWTTEWYAAALLDPAFDAAAISADQLTKYLGRAGTPGTPATPAAAGA